MVKRKRNIVKRKGTQEVKGRNKKPVKSRHLRKHHLRKRSIKISSNQIRQSLANAKHYHKKNNDLITELFTLRQRYKKLEAESKRYKNEVKLIRKYRTGKFSHLNTGLPTTHKILKLKHGIRKIEYKKSYQHSYYAKVNQRNLDTTLKRLNDKIGRKTKSLYLVLEGTSSNGKKAVYSTPILAHKDYEIQRRYIQKLKVKYGMAKIKGIYANSVHRRYSVKMAAKIKASKSKSKNRGK